MQHGGKTALVIEPRHEANRRAGRGEADEIAHRIGARAPFLAGVFADHGVVNRDLSERAHHDADRNQNQRQVRQRRRKIQERRQHKGQRQRHRLQRVMIEQFASSYMRHTEQQKELARAQLQALTAQLQPHFFFNVLNSVSALMRHDPEAADEMIGRLSDLIRVTLKDAPLEVSLRQELALVTNYIEIERMRFVDRLRFAVHATDEVLDAAVPPLLLLPIVENAVRYAITPRTSAGRIDVEALREKDTLAATIKDDGPGHQNGTCLTEGIGLSNTRMRLQKHYLGEASFSYRTLAPSGFEVEFRLPYRPAAAEVQN